MIRTRAVGILLLALVIVSLDVAVNAAQPVTERAATESHAGPMAELWRKTLVEADYPQVMATYGLLNELKDDEDELSAERCESRAEDLLKALKTNPVSLAVLATAAECAVLREDEATAERHLQTFGLLVRHALESEQASEVATPIVVMAEMDVVAFIKASGHEVLYSYYDMYSSTRKLPLMVALWDADAQIERLYAFDYLDAQMQLRHVEKGSEFPWFRRAFAKSIIDVYGEVPGSTAGEALALRKALSKPELADRLSEAEALARQGNYGATMALVYGCLRTRHAGCAERSIDVLLPLAEERVSGALIALALFHAQGFGTRRDDKAAGALLDLADQRLGAGNGSVLFAGVQIPSTESTPLNTFTHKRLLSAAKAGNDYAQGLLAAVEWLRRDGKALKKDVRAGLERAARRNIPAAQSLLGELLIGEGKAEEGMRWLESAARFDHLAAQIALAKRYAEGTDVAKDVEKARRWKMAAAQGGDIDSVLWLVQHYAAQKSTPATRLQLEGWLQSAAYVGNVDAAIALARLNATGAPGLMGKPDQALRIYRELLEKHDRADLRRELATLLLWGADGVEKNPAEARRLLLDDANKGDVESQAALGTFMLGGMFGEVEQEGVDWLNKASASDDGEAFLSLGNAHYYGKGLALDRKAGIRFWERAVEKGLPMASNNLAWALCTVDDESLIDAQRGLAVITLLESKGEAQDLASLDTLAACHAATGDFAKAIELQARVVADAEDLVGADDNSLVGMKNRLKLYESHERFTEREEVD